MSRPVIGSPIFQRTGNHLPMLNGKDVIPLSTHEPNKLPHDETPHLVIHTIKYMAMIEFQKSKTDQVIKV